MNANQIDIILSLYEAGFSSVKKEDVDLAVFHIICLSNDKLANRSYIEYDRLDFNELSVQLKITVTKVISLVEKVDLKYGIPKSDQEIALYLLKLAEKYYTGKSELRDSGCFSIPVPNRILKNRILTVIDRCGGVVDYSFNRDILSIKISDFMNAFSYTIDEATRKKQLELLLKGLDSKNEIIKNNSDYKVLMKNINKKSAEENMSMLVEMLKSLGRESMPLAIQVAGYYLSMA